MSQWIERFQNHRVHELVKMTATLLEQTDSLKKSEVGAVDGFVRLRQIHDIVVTTLSSVDPTLVPPQPIEHLANAVTSLNQELTHYNKNESVGHLNNANGHADATLAQLANILVPSSPQDVDTIRESVSNYKRSASQQVRRLEEESKVLGNSLTELTNRSKETTAEVISQKGRLDNAIAEFQKQFSDTENSRRAEFSTLLKEGRSEFEAFKENIETDLEALTEKIEERLKAALERDESRATEHAGSFKALRSEVKDEVAVFFQEKSEVFTERQAQFEQSAKQAIEDLEERKREAANLVQIISNIGVTGNYSRTADENRGLANRWRWIAVSLMTIMASVGIWTVWYAVTEFDWRLTLARMFATLVIAVPAFYAAKESEKHRKLEERNRMMELELASIDPYLEKLPTEKREELKASLTDRFFGNTDIGADKEDMVSAQSMFGLIKTTVHSLLKK